MLLLVFHVDLMQDPLWVQSANMCSVEQYCNRITPISNFSRMKWYCTSMCFVREWCVRFFASEMLPWLLHMIVVAYEHLDRMNGQCVIRVGPRGLWSNYLQAMDSYPNERVKTTNGRSTVATKNSERCRWAAPKDQVGPPSNGSSLRWTGTHHKLHNVPLITPKLP